jgi:cell wall-associated NlpC family hydrolase
MPSLPRQGSVPVRVLLCCVAVAVGVLVLSSGSAGAKHSQPAKRHHHAHPSSSRPRHHVRRRHHGARRHRARAGRAQRFRAERRRRNRVVRLARRTVSAPYRWGGGSPGGGFDCTGLTRWVYGHVGVSLPNYTVAQWSYGRRVARRAIVPGDLLFFSGLGHVGIYIGHGALIHAPHTGARVRAERLSGRLASSFDGARRLFR